MPDHLNKLGNCQPLWEKPTGCGCLLKSLHRMLASAVESRFWLGPTARLTTGASNNNVPVGLVKCLTADQRVSFADAERARCAVGDGGVRIERLSAFRLCINTSVFAARATAESKLNTHIVAPPDCRVPRAADTAAGAGASGVPGSASDAAEVANPGVESVAVGLGEVAADHFGA